MDYLRRTPVIEIDLPGEADTQALGRAIARRAGQGDMIALEGGLGAGTVHPPNDARS